MEPKYKIGDVFYITRTTSEQRSYECPDCLGAKVMRVVAPSGDEFTADCPRCTQSHYGNSKIPSLKYTHHMPVVQECPITGYTVNAYSSGKIEYGSSQRQGSSYNVLEDEMILTREEAEVIAQRKADEANEKQNASPERMEQQHFKDLKIREATDDMFANGLYNAWSSFRYLREGVDDVTGEEGENLSASEIRESLEKRLQDAMRYDFIFKDFVRFMETLANAEAGNEEAKALVSERWAELPERLKSVWTSRTKSRWMSEEIPSF